MITHRVNSSSYIVSVESKGGNNLVIMKKNSYIKNSKDKKEEM